MSKRAPYETAFSGHGLLVSGGKKYACHLTLWQKEDQSWAGAISNIDLASMLILEQLYPACSFVLSKTRWLDGQTHLQYIEGLEINLEDFSHDSVGVAMSSEPVITLIPVKSHG